MSLPVYTAPIYPKLLQFAFVMLELALKPCVVDLLDSILMSSVAPISLLRYSPMPPGFWLSVDRSPPRAVNAPPIDMKRAVPRRPCCESWNASVAENELYFYLAPDNNAVVNVDGCDSNTVIWNVTDPANP